MSAERVFVDTNVLLYAFDRSAGVKRRRAADLLEGVWRSGGGCVSVQVLQEFYVNSTRKIANPLEAETAKSIVTYLGRWRVHEPLVEDVLAAIELQQNANLSFWDAMIVQSADKLGCGVVYSEDLNPGQVFAGVRVVNPLEERSEENT